MSTIEEIRTKLIADAAVNALIAGRVHASKLPQGGTFPAVVCQVISDVPENALVESGAGRRSIIRLQIDAYAGGYIEADTLASAIDAVVSALATPDLTAWRMDRRDLYDDEASLHRVSQDFSVAR